MGYKEKESEREMVLENILSVKDISRGYSMFRSWIRKSFYE